MVPSDGAEGTGLASGSDESMTAILPRESGFLVLSRATDPCRDVVRKIAPDGKELDSVCSESAVAERIQAVVPNPLGGYVEAALTEEDDPGKTLWLRWVDAGSHSTGDWHAVVTWPRWNRNHRWRLLDSANGPATNADMTAILNEVDTWYSLYGGFIDGIFYDRGPEFTIGGPTDAQFQSFYVQLYQNTKLRHPSAIVMLNAAGFPNDWIMTIPATDYATIWENSLSAYVNQYVAIGPSGTVPVPAWWSDPIYTSRGKLADIVYDATQLDINNVVSLSRNRGSRVLYIHDRTTANYSGLACYFEQEVAAAQNQAVPPGAKTFCGTACTDITADNSNCGGPTTMAPAASELTAARQLVADFGQDARRCLDVFRRHDRERLLYRALHRLAVLRVDGAALLGQRHPEPPPVDSVDLAHHETTALQPLHDSRHGARVQVQHRGELAQRKARVLPEDADDEALHAGHAQLHGHSLGPLLHAVVDGPQEAQEGKDVASRRQGARAHRKWPRAIHRAPALRAAPRGLRASSRFIAQPPCARTAGTRATRSRDRRSAPGCAGSTALATPRGGAPEWSARGLPR